ncbi:MAG TPA: hypothetical protein VM115_09905 [Vicinamibacterales bacterium]|nr:hypothetical protein [Vicinamibacterales bacterium]
MRAAFGAIGGALAVGAMLVSYNLGARNSFSGQMTAPTTQMMVGPDGIARPYLVQAGQAGVGQVMPGQYGYPYSTTTPAAVAPMGYAPVAAYPAYQPAPYPVQTQYVTERAVQAPVRRVSSTQRVSSEVKPRRTWQKSALLIGGSAGAGAGVGALIGGKKGALSGAAIGGGAAAIYDQIKRH